MKLRGSLLIIFSLASTRCQTAELPKSSVASETVQQVQKGQAGDWRVNLLKSPVVADEATLQKLIQCDRTFGRKDALNIVSSLSASRPAGFMLSRTSDNHYVAFGEWTPTQIKVYVWDMSGNRDLRRINGYDDGSFGGPDEEPNSDALILGEFARLESLAVMGDVLGFRQLLDEPGFDHDTSVACRPD